MAWEIVHIPGKPAPSLDPPTVDVLAATVEPRVANTLVRQLNQICPLENLRHVKRVRRRSVEGKIELAVILCPSLEENHVVGMPTDMFQLIGVNQLSPFVAKVPKHAATTKEEWEEQCKLWPTSYHPPHNGDSIAGFSEDSQIVSKYMKAALQLTRSSHLGDEVVNAAVIVDPLQSQIIATGCDQTYSRPITARDSSKCANSIEQAVTIGSLLSVMNGRSSDEDVNPKSSADDCSHSYTGVSCLCPCRWTEQRPNNSSSESRSGENCLWHPLRHATLVAIENAAARDRLLFPTSNPLTDQPLQNDILQDSSIDIPAKRQKTQISEDNLRDDASTDCLLSEATRPYLCTGFDIYLVWEPCTMCAMALVHQRIRRIFYAFPNPNCGALGSVYRLQGERSLNHHYSVYRILLPERILCDLGAADSANCLTPV